MHYLDTMMPPGECQPQGASHKPHRLLPAQSRAHGAVYSADPSRALVMNAAIRFGRNEAKPIPFWTARPGFRIDRIDPNQRPAHVYLEAPLELPGLIRRIV